MRPIARIALGEGGEFDLIRRFLQHHAGEAAPGVLVGPGDDCAILSAGRVALSVDLAIEDVHFRRAWLSAEEIGFRSAAAALSDLAAVAAVPVGILVSLAVAPEDAGPFAEGIMAGATAAAAEAGATLLGGDMSRSPGPAIIDIVAAGTVDDPVLRNGARAGDTLWVTGRLGGAAAAVAELLAGGEPIPEARAAYAHPSPRHREARWLAERGLMHASIDLSDGLAGDARHMAAASGVRVLLDAAAVPVHEGAGGHATRSALDLALHGGEDYELLFAAAEDEVQRVAEDFAREFNTPLTRVGHVEAGRGVWLLDMGGQLSEVGRGFDHFPQETT